MHGIILYELGRFAEERMGAEGWHELLRSLGLDGATFTPVQAEPDERVLRVVQALARERSLPLEDLLREFGRWMAPHLLATYAPLIPAGWDVADILENAESVIHRAVRLRDPIATPPRLVTSRRDDGTIVIEYSSERRLCHFAAGLVQGIALSHGRVATVTQPACMHAGDPHCELVVRLD